MKTKVEYIHHSCFTVETDNIFLVFDYFKGNLNLPRNKKIYFLSSHAHSDHFSTSIFDCLPKVTNYILSDDIKDLGYEKTIFVSQDQKIRTDSFDLYTFGSTDEGISFIVEIDSKYIFHSGDLNDWYWEMEDDENQKNFMHNNFVNEVNKMLNFPVDVAFFPVDPRQEGQFDLGGKQILEKLKPRHFFPAHFWRKYQTTEKFAKKYEDLYPETRIYTIQKENQKFELNL